ncbi:hypothetical protein H8D30_06730, partial [bacterium]|nr:hypothetical protein [bacterium]
MNWRINILLVLGLFLGGSHLSGAGSTTVSWEINESESRVTLFLTFPVPVTHRNEAFPTRLVFNVPGGQLEQDAPTKVKRESGFVREVKAISIEDPDEFLRLVFTFSLRVPIEDSDYRYVRLSPTRYAFILDKSRLLCRHDNYLREQRGEEEIDCPT